MAPISTRRRGPGDHVLWATIDHPPINLLDAALVTALDALSREAQTDPSVRVLVVDSADEDFWIAHADVEGLIGVAQSGIDIAAAVAPFHGMLERFRTMEKPTIAVVAGRARGGGCEVAMSFDMRYGALGRTLLGQPEVALGLIPGGSGTQRWPRLTNRSRALEVVLGGHDIDAVTAEKWGALTRALPPDELVPFVTALAARVAASPPEAVAAAKVAVDAAGDSTATGIAAGLQAEAAAFASTMTESTAARMQVFLAEGGQERAGELDLPQILERLPPG
jgi:enoyl-CoA hydratase/carnithine racemase